MAKKAAVKGFSVAREFAFNPTIEVGGVWFDYKGGSRLLIARYGNPEHVNLERRLEAQHAQDLQSKDPAVQAEARTAINMAVFSHTILKGWEGILDEDGETELKYTQETAAELLKHQQFFNAVLEFAVDSESFLKYKKDDAVKN